MATEDRSVAQEIKAVGEALTNRFGWRAFTSKADKYAEKQMIDRMPEGISAERQGEVTAIFEAVRRFDDRQQLAEKREPTKAVAPAMYEPGASVEANQRPTVPMISAVTAFAVSVDEEARNAAMLNPRYKRERTALADAVTRVWRDPAATLAVIEDLISKDVGADRIASAIANDPAAYGAVRGSDRLVDRLGAAGRERRDAVAAIGGVGDRVRMFAQAWGDLVRSERARVETDRERMAIPIPALSPKAELALSDLARSTAKAPKDIRNLVRQVDRDIRSEFAVVSKALDARFGPNVIGSGDASVFQRIPASQRTIFEIIQPRLRLIQHAVHTDRTQDVVAERQTRILRQGRSLTR